MVPGSPRPTISQMGIHIEPLTKITGIQSERHEVDLISNKKTLVHSMGNTETRNNNLHISEGPAKMDLLDKINTRVSFHLRK